MQNLRSLAVFLCILGAAFSLHAQVAGRVTGTVVDATGAAIPGANVSLQLPGGGTAAYTTTTNASGDFIVPTVNPGVLAHPREIGYSARLRTIAW